MRKTRRERQRAEKERKREEERKREKEGKREWGLNKISIYYDRKIPIGRMCTEKDFNLEND